MLNQDYRDMLSALSEAGVEFLLVGAYAVAAHGYPRATGDLDLWVRPSRENAKRVWAALEAFGAPKSKLTVEDFTAPDVVYQIGVAPRRIDLLTSVSGIEFDAAWQNRVSVELDGLSISVLGRDDLIRNKRATGRTRDLADAEMLESDEAP